MCIASFSESVSSLHFYYAHELTRTASLMLQQSI